MNDKEVTTFLKDLRSKYMSSSEEYGTHYFNIDDLEKRIEMQKQSKLPFTLFVRDEILFFEQMKNIALKNIERYQQKEKRKGHMNSIIDSNEDKIKKYPDIFFNPVASLEMRYFFGAITEFYNKFYYSLAGVFDGLPENENFKKLSADVEHFYFYAINRLPLMALQYIEEVSDGVDKNPEQIDRKYLQTGGVYLYNLSSFLKKNRIYTVSLHKPIIEKAIHTIEIILIDFRLLNLVKLK